MPPILPILLKEPTTRRTLSCAFRNNGRMPSAPTGQRRLGCPHESIPQHPRRRNPTTCSSLCALHEAYFSRSTVYFIALTLPHCREFVKRGGISFFFADDKRGCVPGKSKIMAWNCNENLSPLLQKLYMNDKIFLLTQFFVERTE